MPPSPLRRAVARLRRPRVGVVVLTGGEPIAVRRTLASVRSQTGVDVELVEVDADEAAWPAERLAAVRRLRAPRVSVLVPGVELLPRALENLVASRGTSEGSVAGRHHAPPMLARMLARRDDLVAALREDDDRDGVLPALRLLQGPHQSVPAAVVREARVGERRALFVRSPWTELDERLRVLTAGRDLAPDPHAFVRGWLARDASSLVESGEHATDEQWTRFVAHVDRAELWTVPVETRAALWLALTGSREQVTEFVASRRFETGLPTHVEDGRVIADLDVLPPELRVMLEEETPLRTLLTRYHDERNGLAFEIFAGIEHVSQGSTHDVFASVTLDWADGSAAVPVTVGSDPAVDRWMGDRWHDHGAGRLNGWTPIPVGQGRIAVELVVDGVHRSGWVRHTDAMGSASAAGDIGDFVVVDPAPLHEDWMGEGPVRDVVVADDAIVVTVPAGDVRLTDDDGLALPGVREHADRWRFRTVVDRWGTGERPAPTGRYRLLVDGQPARPSQALLARLPEETQTPTHRTTVRVRDHDLVVRLDPPLTDDEFGPRPQALLQAAHAEVTEPLDPQLVYFQSFTGQAANDHPLAIQQELHRRRPDLDVRWLVADAHPAPPAGARAVQHRSREWYDVLARAAHVVTNIDLERWFRRREGQQVLQTYHGYPSKRMGIDQWRARGFPPSRIAQDLARSSGTWTALLTPQPDADELYRSAYAYDGPILSVGYPRDDVLVGPDAERIRAEVRDRLHLGSRRVVLWAPTWRHDLATDFRRAEAGGILDPQVLAEALGDDWVVLARGHRFHAAGRSSSRVLDVTTYPDVNDLILAADAAVLDYSSLRFDFALTGRPAVYLVPDLDRYVGTVRGFYQDYADTAPGPLVTSTVEVADRLLDYDALVAATRDPIAAFNARFNTLADGHASQRVVDAFFAALL